jgi:hypothetical protein
LKIELKELKRAIDFLEKNSKEIYVYVDVFDEILTLNTFDKSDAEISIEVYTAGTLMPKVKKTETL